MEKSLYEEIAERYYLKNYGVLLWDGEYYTEQIRAYNEEHLLKIIKINFSDSSLYSYWRV